MSKLIVLGIFGCPLFLMRCTIIRAAALLGKWTALVLGTSWRQRLTICDGESMDFFAIFLIFALYSICIRFSGSGKCLCALFRLMIECSLPIINVLTVVPQPLALLRAHLQ